MKKKAVNLIICSMILLTTASCNGLTTGVGIRGIVCDNDLMTLDGDTFRIQERIDDSLLIVCHYPEDNDHHYLIKQERNGFYYIQQEGNSISAIDNTQEYVCVDGKIVYNWKDKTSFSVACDASYLYYLGQRNGRVALTNQDSICFSDGKCIALQEDAFCTASDTKGNVVLRMGSRRLQVPIEKLYQYEHKVIPTERDVVRFTKKYFVTPRSLYGSGEAGFGVDLDIPKGTADCDNAIREWMVSSIKDDAFSLLDFQREVPVGNSGSVRDMASSLDTYGVLWEKLCKSYFQEEDTLVLRMTCNVRSRKIVDCYDYTTYYYWSSIYDGGLHEMPKSYYITYDKRRKMLVTASNTVKTTMMKQFREETLRRIKLQYDENYDGTSDYDDFLQSVFSFHCPMFDMSSWDETTRSLLEHEYICDEWSGWGYIGNDAFTLDNFPLPHLAVLPEGIVLSYHPYQIDCFMSGEYHVLIPFEKISHCLQYKYCNYIDGYPKLEQFIK